MNSLNANIIANISVKIAHLTYFSSSSRLSSASRRSSSSRCSRSSLSAFSLHASSFIILNMRKTEQPRDDADVSTTLFINNSSSISSVNNINNRSYSILETCIQLHLRRQFLHNGTSDLCACMQYSNI